MKSIFLSSSPLHTLRTSLDHFSFDGIIIPHSDAYQGEYLVPRDEWLSFLTGFSGSAGILIVLEEKAALFVDGRYTLQAQNQVNTNLFELHPLGNEVSWVTDQLQSLKEPRIAYNPWCMTSAQADNWKKKISHFIPFEEIFQNLWPDRPAHPSTTLFPHPLKYAGKDAQEKIDCAQEKMKDVGVDLCVLGPESWHWLFNVRGNDLHYTPLSQGFAVLHGNGKITLYLHYDKQTLDLPGIFLKPIEALEKDLKNEGSCLGYDSLQTPVAITNLFEKKKAFSDPCVLPKACKNPVEIQGAIEAHIQDGIAWITFWHWLENALSKDSVLYELDIVEKLESFRAQQPDFHSLSFASIVGSGSHGAIVHYKATPESNRKLEKNELLLLDSGGQYHCGTTDITRTLAIGTPTALMKQHYTLVLKGHLTLGHAIFPKDTSGAQLDALARAPLWKENLDFAHGTGHGVGSFLSVHEGPQRISKAGHHPLHAGMILSNEPGYYKEGAYGIRIENLMYVKEISEEWLGFSTLTLVPYDHRLIDFSLLTEEEKAWISAYHAQVFETLSPHLTLPLKAFLKEKCGVLVL